MWLIQYIGWAKCDTYTIALVSLSCHHISCLDISQLSINFWHINPLVFKARPDLQIRQIYIIFLVLLWPLCRSGAKSSKKRRIIQNFELDIYIFLRWNVKTKLIGFIITAFGTQGYKSTCDNIIIIHQINILLSNIGKITIFL